MSRPYTNSLQHGNGPLQTGMPSRTLQERKHFRNLEKLLLPKKLRSSSNKTKMKKTPQPSTPTFAPNQIHQVAQSPEVDCETAWDLENDFTDRFLVYLKKS